MSKIPHHPLNYNTIREKNSITFIISDTKKKRLTKYKNKIYIDIIYNDTDITNSIILSREQFQDAYNYFFN